MQLSILVLFSSKGDRQTLGLEAEAIIAIAGWLVPQAVHIVIDANGSRKTLNPDLLQRQVLPANTSRAEHTGPAVLSASPASSSGQKYVTEGTTELLTPQPLEREKELVYRKGKDTSPTG